MSINTSFQRFLDVLRASDKPNLLNQDIVGDFDLNLFTPYKNPDGSLSTVRSMSFSDGNGKEILIPTVIAGESLTPEEAVQKYRETGLKLGTFDSVDEANAFAETLHQKEERRIFGNGKREDVNKLGYYSYP